MATTIVEITGTISHTSQPKQLNSGKYVQEIVITNLADIDERTGRKKGNDQHYPVKVFKNNREDFKRAEWLRKKCKVTCYLNGREYTHNRDGLQWSLQLSLKNIELI